MCPASTLKMKKLQDLVSKTNVPFVKFLSITLDPEYDTPEFLSHTLVHTTWMNKISNLERRERQLSMI